MIDATHQDIRDIAGRVVWSDSTLLFLIARWADETGQARALLEHLNQAATQEDEANALD